MGKLYKNFRIFLVLLRRELKFLCSNFIEMLLDAMPVLLVQVVTFGYLFPLLGMPSLMIGPIYLGSMLSLFLQLGFTFVLKTGFDLENNRCIDYHMTLPISKYWLFAAYAVSLMFELIVATIPLLTAGVFILREHFPISAINWLLVLGMYLLIVTFFATFFLAIAYTMVLSWIMDNIWPRLLTPLWWISGGLVLWKKVFILFPVVSYVMLLSPMTYVAEGLRAVFFMHDQFIAWYICALVLLVWIIINGAFLMYGIHKRLDPV